jgi:hypothetical protein
MKTQGIKNTLYRKKKLLYLILIIGTVFTII